MTKSPKVSIVIPVYNGSNYLKDAIDSALAQTYKNIEIVVVNDGSNDDGATEQIAKSYGKKIKYYHKENGGVATALNLGIKKMTGEYFSWLSHDDLYYQDKIEKQINFLAKLKFKKVFLYSNYSVLTDTLITPVVHNHEMLVRKPKYSLLRGCVNGITVLIPKSIFDEMGGFNEELRCTQDYDYWRRIEAKYEFVHMEDVLSITRLHPNQDSAVSPRVLSESNALWTDMVNKLSDKEKVKYESTLYNFYSEMVAFLQTTPYTGVLKYCKNKLTGLEKNYRKKDINYKVSVVIPFYNRLVKTEKAVESVLKQSYKNVEIVLVNDGSTEDLDGINKLVKRHKRIKLVDLGKNMGPAAARNAGIKKSTGEYIAFLDSDDEFLSNKLEKQLFMMSRYNPDISYTSYTRHEGDNETVVCDPGLTGIVVPRIISNCTIATPTAIVRKSLLIENNIFFDEKLRIGEDTCFWLEIAKHSEILLVNEPLTIVNVGSETHAKDNSKLIVGVRNLITYLLSDDYYKYYSKDIAVICNYFSVINNEIRQQEYDRLLYEGPVVSIRPDAPQARSTMAKLESFVKDSVPYRAARKLYHIGLSAGINRVGGK